MVDKRLMKTKRVKFILLSVLFVLASISAFYGTRLSLPIITNYGRGTLNTIPATLTFAVPIFTLIVLWQYSNTDTIAKRWKTNLIYSIVMIAISLFNIVLILFLLGLLYDWNFIVGVMTPAYPLDLFLFNLIFLAIGCASLFFAMANKKRRDNFDAEGRKKTPKRYHVLAAFFLCFATYFFGEALFGFNELFEGYIDLNAIFVFPVYMAFLLMTLEMIIYVVYIYSPDDKKIKRGLIGITVLLGITALFYTWILIGLAVNSYYFSESMQFEFAIGYALKMPLGLLIIALWILIPSIVALIKIFRKMKVTSHPEPSTNE